jgi:peptidoglycan/xylan/chitin deacetylase (PgdA/CDA1 family)
MQYMKAFKAAVRKTLLRMRLAYDRIFHGHCIVLLYHRVARLQTDPQLLAVTPAHFDLQLAYLKKHYQVLTVEEFTHHLLNNIRFPKHSVLLTFDDGYADNFTEALPLLEKHDLQALFYIATGTLGGTREFWWDAVERIVLLSETEPAEKQFVLHGVQYDLQALTFVKRTKLYNDLLPVLRRTPVAERDGKINELAALFGSAMDRPSHRAMTFEELKQMHVSPSAVIGAHTEGHPSLAALSYEQQRYEIATSKKLLEETLGGTIQHFSYPFGTILDYNADTLKIVRELNFSVVAANYPEPVSSRSDRFTFPRFLVRDWDIPEFEKQMRAFAR